MTADVKNNQPGPGENRFGLETGLGEQNMQERGQQGQPEPKETTKSAFTRAMDKARGVGVNGADLQEEIQGIAGQILAGLKTAQVPQATREAKPFAQGVTDSVAQAVGRGEKAEGLALGKSGEIQLPMPPNVLGLETARLMMVNGEMALVLRVAGAVDASVIAAAITELSATLAQRFPNRGMRVLREDEIDGKFDTKRVDEFNPFTHPVGRKTT